MIKYSKTEYAACGTLLVGKRAKRKYRGQGSQRNALESGALPWARRQKIIEAHNGTRKITGMGSLACSKDKDEHGENGP